MRTRSLGDSVVAAAQTLPTAYPQAYESLYGQNIGQGGVNYLQNIPGTATFNANALLSNR